MRTTVVLAFAAALSPHAAAADVVRHKAIPEAYWGTWAPGTESCKDGDQSAIILSANTYVGRFGSCAVEYVSEIATSRGAIYSARLLCPSQGAQAQKKTIANLIIRPNNGAQMSIGPTFESLTVHHRCFESAPGVKE